MIRVDFINKGPDHAPRWIAKNPLILDGHNNVLIPLNMDITSEECKSKKDAEQELYLKILEYLKNNIL